MRYPNISVVQETILKHLYLSSYTHLDTDITNGKQKHYFDELQN